MRILDVCCRWPGSSHDATIFVNSTLCEKLERGDLGNDVVILGDSAYGMQSFVCKPLAEPVTRAEKNYQNAHIKTRNVGERGNGILKREFPCLQLGMRFHIDKIQDIIVACCVLHNFLLEEREEEDIIVIEQEEQNLQANLCRQLADAQRAHIRPISIQRFLIQTYFNRG